MRLAGVVGMMCASLFSCGGSREHLAYDWYVDERFTPEERARIEEGAEWLYANARLPPPQMYYGVHREDAAHIPRAIWREASSGRAGACVSGSIYIDPEQADIYLDSITAHEMGHCVLGFEDRYWSHPKRTNGIMRVLAPRLWTSNEEEQCDATGLCGPR